MAQTGQYSQDDIAPQTYSPSDIAQATPDAFERAVNYHTGIGAVDLPLGVLQGAAKGAASTGVGIGALYRKLAGLPPLPGDTFASDITPSGAGQGTGKFLEQTAEFAIPGGAASKALEGAGLAARFGAQAGIGAGVSGLQSGGDPKSMLIGGALGGGGELAGTALGRIRALANAPKVATLENFRDSFAATPKQLEIVQQAMPTLAKYGIGPQAGVQEMQDAIRAQMQDLGQQYAAREAAGIGDKTMSGSDVIQQLEDLKKPYTTSSGNVPSKRTALVSQIDEQIADVKKEMDSNGNIKFRDLRTLRDAANESTNWLAPVADQNINRGIGDVYRSGMESIEPGTAELNRDWANLAAADKAAAKNISYGRGLVPSRFEQGLQKAAGPTTGALIGSQLGAGTAHLFGLPPTLGATAGSAAGAFLYPKLTGPAVQALKNAADSGALNVLPGAQKAALSMAAKLGDNAAILRILGQGAISSAVAQAAPTTAGR